MTHTTAPTMELLLAEADWLRRLVRHLVSDPGMADEVVQETWIAALKSGPIEAISQDRSRRRGWLAKVARRMAGRQSGRQRLLGERQAVALEVRGDREPLRPGEVAERMELQQEVAAATLLVNEPYRSTLYLLYYEGRTQVEVASMLGVTESTIRSRAFRGREAIREALCRDGRDWSCWSAALAPWLRLPPGGAAGSTVVAGSKALSGSSWATARWAALAVFGLTALGGAWWINRSGVEPGVFPPSVEVEPIVVAASGPGSLEPIAVVAAAPAARAPVDPSAADGGSSTGPVLAHGEIQDTNGEPLGGAYLMWQLGTEVIRVRSGADDGSWAVPALGPGTWSLMVTHAKYRSWAGEVEVLGEAAVHVDVVLHPKRLAYVRLLDAEGEPWTGDVKLRPATFTRRAKAITLEQRWPSERLKPLSPGDPDWYPRPSNEPTLYPSVIATEAEPPSVLTDLPAGRPWHYGCGEWRELGNTHMSGRLALGKGIQGRLEVLDDGPVWVSLVYGSVVLESLRFDELPEMIEFHVTQEQLRQSHGTIRFAVHDAATGASKSEAFVTDRPSIYVDGHQPVWIGLEEGLVTIYDVMPGLHDVKIGSQNRSYERMVFPARVESGIATVLSPITLLEAKPFEVSLLDADGAPVSAHISAHRTAAAAGTALENWPGNSTTNSSGRALIQSVAEGPITLHVRSLKGSVRFTTTIDTAASTEIDLVLPATTPVQVKTRLSGSLPRYDLLDSGGVSLNLFGILNGLLRLPPGTYRLRARDTANPTLHPIVVGTEPLAIDLDDYL